MFKAFNLDKKYLFDLDGNCNVPLQTNPVNDLLGINIDRVTYFFEKKWLGLISHYEVDLPVKELSKIGFVECRSKVIGLKCENLMVFHKPIKYNDVFYVVPGFTRFAITKDGSVISIKHGTVLKPSIGPYGYPYVNVYDPDKGKWRSVSLHILLARTFVKNPDPVNKFFVNHKDGNKLNFDLQNLEWVTSLENQEHAVENGLRNDNNPCKILDTDTGTIQQHASIGSALKSIGMKVTNCKLVSKVNGQLVPSLFMNRYEIKLLNDESKWFYTKNMLSGRPKSVGPFQAKHLATGTVIEEQTLSALSERTNVSRSTAEDAVRYPGTKAFSGFLFRLKSDEEWPTSYEEAVYHKPRQLLLTNIVTGEKLSFDSLRKTYTYLDIDKRTLKNRLKANKTHKDWKIEEIEG